MTPVPLPSLMPFVENFFVTSSSQHRFSIGVDLVAARGAVAEAAAAALLGLLLDDVDNVDGDSVLKQVLGLGVDVQLARLGVLGEVEGGDLGDVLVLALTLLLLQLEGDTSDGTLLNTLH
ncbi:hypothetical protein FJTKL_03043 [Diaporthe vaccinii]|uniref:Uncharacterized protein n=1 Tax=Diaporthe vaccinii TaxID=105482 RepID=A0ABR4DWC6_9PEZI